MNTKISLPIVILIGLFIVGCTTVGNKTLKYETRESLEEKIQEGITTKEEILKMLGDPLDTNFTDSGFEILRYSFSRSTPKAKNFIPYNFFSVGSDVKKKELVILFNENDIVKRFSMIESEVDISSGLAE